MSKMNWQTVVIIGLLLTAGVVLVALGQATIAGGAITSAIGIAALFTNAKKSLPELTVEPPPADETPEPNSPPPGGVN